MLTNICNSSICRSTLLCVQAVEYFNVIIRTLLWFPAQIRNKNATRPVKLQLARVVKCVLFLVQVESRLSAVEDALSSMAQGAVLQRTGTTWEHFLHLENSS